LLRRQQLSINLSLAFSLLPASLAEFSSLPLSAPSRAFFLLFYAGTPPFSYDLIRLSAAGAEAIAALSPQLASSFILQSASFLRANHFD
jgi:hypothetical protein